MDLAGNTFWEFKDSLNANRLRRIAKHNPRTHYSDIQVSRKSRSFIAPIDSQRLGTTSC